MEILWKYHRTWMIYYPQNLTPYIYDYFHMHFTYINYDFHDGLNNVNLIIVLKRCREYL